MTAPANIVIVGASAAGLSAAETLRAEGYAQRLTLVGEEVHAPYDRPPLSKQLLSGEWTQERVAMRDAADLEKLEARWLLGRRATGLCLRCRELSLDDGSTLAFDALLIATGVKPRTLPGIELDGAYALRSLEDAVSLRSRLVSARRVVVIGGGFLGTEAASVMRGVGLDVTLAYPEAYPLERSSGLQLGQRVASLHDEKGVHLRPLCSAVRLLGDAQGRLRAVAFADGTECEADLALVAIGSTPATGWLAGSGLQTPDGVECDAFCMAADNVYAAGDVARWEHRGVGRSMRLEHRMNATEQGMAAARNMLGANEAFMPLPYVWSDQYAERLQFYGTFPPDAHVEIQELASDSRRLTAVYRVGGTPVGVMGWNAPRELRALRASLVQASAR
jgi:3-phenylpropionate/trans-cinnamate dioxygenase ferredoxin reductase subunit